MKKVLSTSLVLFVMIDGLVAQSYDLSESWEFDTDFMFMNHLEKVKGSNPVGRTRAIL